MTDTSVIPQFFTLSEARKALGSSAPSITRLRAEIAAGNLRAKRIGRCLRVTDVELRRWALDVDQVSTATEPTAKPYSGVPQADSLPASLGGRGPSGGAS